MAQPKATTEVRARARQPLQVAHLGDLFAAADAAAALIGAPVIVEDARFRLLAYSRGQQDVDEARVATIVMRRPPSHFVERLRQMGVLDRVRSSEEPVLVERVLPRPRLIMPVRAGHELIGFLTAMMIRTPTEDQRRAVAESAAFLALHLLRHRLASDLQRRLGGELGSAVLEGGPLAGHAARRLGLDRGGFRVCALAVGPDGSGVGSTERLLDILGFRLARFGGRAAAAAIGDSVYLVLADSTAGATRDLARRLAGEVLRSPASLAGSLAVAAGSHETRLADVPRSRRRADLVMDVVRQRSLGLAIYEDVEAQALLARARRCTREDPDLADGLLDQIAAHDATHGSHHLATVSAYLHANGSVEATAGVLGLHKNTVRQRLAKIASTFAMDLSDPDVRLGLALATSSRDGP